MRVIAWAVASSAWSRSARAWSRSVSASRRPLISSASDPLGEASLGGGDALVGGGAGGIDLGFGGFGVGGGAEIVVLKYYWCPLPRGLAAPLTGGSTADGMISSRGRAFARGEGKIKTSPAQMRGEPVMGANARRLPRTARDRTRHLRW